MHNFKINKKKIMTEIEIELDINEFSSNADKLISNLDLICTNIKHDERLYKLVEAHTQLFHKLGQKINSSLKTLKNLKRKKKKAAYRSLLANTELKSKKIQEKTDVLEQLTYSTQNSIAYSNQAELISSEKNVERLKEKLSNKQPAELEFSLHKCYICKDRYRKYHFFYDKLCYDCAEFNYKKRKQSCDFTNRIALVTGCRIKIGYEICLYLLRNNCKVIGTSRFCKDAFLRYSKEPDFDSFKHNLVIYPLDLRDLNGIKRFIKYLYRTQPKLDILINNAAQTLRRNAKFYGNLIADETKPLQCFNNEDIYKILPVEEKGLWFNSKCLIQSGENLFIYAKNNLVEKFYLNKLRVKKILNLKFF